MDAFGTTGKWHDDVIRVVVGDDAALLRRRLVIVLENEPDIDVVAEAADGEQAIALARELAPDVVIIGMRVEPGGARSAAGIREVAPSAHVVMLTTHEDELDSVRAVKAGATGFLGREHAEDAPQLIRAVSAGIVALPPLVAQALLAEFDTLTVNAGAVDPRLPSPAITARERAVLEKLAVGKTYAVAAEALGIGDHAVRNLAANAIEKLYRFARTEAVMYAVGERLFQAP